MVLLAVEMTLFVLRVLSLFFHSIGTHLLISGYQSQRNQEQHLYLINLSLTNILLNVLQLLRTPESIFLTARGNATYYEKVEDVTEYTTFQKDLSVVEFTLVGLVYYTTMIYITLHRLFKILLNLKYTLYWNEEKAKRLLLATWMAGFLFWGSFSFAHKYKWSAAVNFIYEYAYMPIDIVFLVLFFISYAVIIWTRIHSLKKRLKHMNASQVGEKRYNSVRVLRDKCFYVPLALLSSFVVFTAIPDIMFIYFHLVVNDHALLSIVTTVSYFTTVISHMDDAAIYIIMHPSVRRLLWRRLKTIANYLHASMSRRIKQLQISFTGSPVDSNVAEARRNHFNHGTNSVPIYVIPVNL